MRPPFFVSCNTSQAAGVTPRNRYKSLISLALAEHRPDNDAVPKTQEVTGRARLDVRTLLSFNDPSAWPAQRAHPLEYRSCPPLTILVPGLQDASAPDVLAPAGRALLVEQVEKDLASLRTFYLLMKKPFPIRHLDLVWADRDRTYFGMGLRGRPDAGTAVPVVVQGRRVATLFSRQALPGESAAETIETMEALAKVLASSWLRLAEAAREEQLRRGREVELAGQEFAYLALQGGAADRRKLQELLATLSLSICPNRVLVVETGAGDPASDVDCTSAVNAVREHCRSAGQAVAVHLRGKGISVFFYDGSTGSQEAAHKLARGIVRSVEERCGARVRVGVGGAKQDWLLLAESYREAILALASGGAPVEYYRPPQIRSGELSGHLEAVVRAVECRDLDAAAQMIADFGGMVAQHHREDTVTQRMMFWSALTAIGSAIRKIAPEAAAVARLQDEFFTEIAAAEDTTGLLDAYLRCAAALVKDAHGLHAGRSARIVDKARQFVDRALEAAPLAQEVSVSAAARAAGCSRSHLSRLFRKHTGDTFENYVIRKRVQVGKRLLLDPNKSVAEVAELAGFSDQSYFSRVFRKVVGCSPSRFVAEPHRHEHHST